MNSFWDPQSGAPRIIDFKLVRFGQNEQFLGPPIRSWTPANRFQTGPFLVKNFKKTNPCVKTPVSSGVTFLLYLKPNWTKICHRQQTNNKQTDRQPFSDAQSNIMVLRAIIMDQVLVFQELPVKYRTTDERTFERVEIYFTFWTESDGVVIIVRSETSSLLSPWLVWVSNYWSRVKTR